jgi:hypothetical protein
MTGRGHGAAYLSLLAERLRTQGAPVVAIDPDAENLRARRAYAKAGFVGETPVETEAGPAVVTIYAPRHLASSRSNRQPLSRPGVDRADCSKADTSASTCWPPANCSRSSRTA